MTSGVQLVLALQVSLYCPPHLVASPFAFFTAWRIFCCATAGREDDHPQFVQDGDGDFYAIRRDGTVAMAVIVAHEPWTSGSITDEMSHNSFS